MRFSLRLSAPTWADQWNATRKDQEAAENVLKAEANEYANEYGSAPAADLDPTSLAVVSLQTLIARHLKLESVQKASSYKTMKEIVSRDKTVTEVVKQLVSDSIVADIEEEFYNP